MKLYPKPRLSDKVEVGCVITSPHFIYGHKEGHAIVVGGEFHADAVDSSRAKAVYVVIEASMFLNPGGFSSWPCGWSVRARRLSEDGLDTGGGEVIQFFQYFIDGGASYGLIKEVTVVGEMDLRFV